MTSAFLFCGTALAQKITLGSYTLKDGGLYKGEMVSGKATGKGVATYKNGDMYEGGYAKGKRHGYGVYSFSDGEKYEGQWFQDQQHGKGVFYFPTIINMTVFGSVTTSRDMA